MNNINNASSPPKKANAALALDDQNVYLFGGNHSDNFVSIWVFDLSKDQWKELLVERADKDDIVTRKKYFISGQGRSENRNLEEMENSNDPAYRVIELMEDITKVCGTILDDGRIGFLSYRIILQPEYEKEKNRCRFFLTKIGNKNATNAADDGLNCVQEELNILDIDGSLTHFCHNDGLPTFHPIAHNSGRKFFFVTLNVQKINLDELNEKNAKLINKKEFDTFFIYELAKGESDCWEWQRISDEANLTLVNVNGDVVPQKEFMEILRMYADCSAIQCLFSFQKYNGIFRNLKLDEMLLFDTIERTFLLKPLKGDPNSGFPICRVHSRLDAITAFQKENEDQILYCIGGLFYKDQQGEQRSDECWKLNLSHFQWEFSGHKPIQRPVYDYSTILSIKDKTIYIYGGITDCIRWPEPECNILQRIHL